MHHWLKGMDARALGLVPVMLQQIMVYIDLAYIRNRKILRYF